jgi:hypothetical protein
MAVTQTIAYVAPAGLSIANVLAGTGVEYMGRASVVDLYATADIGPDTFGLTYQLGGDARVVVPAGSAINKATAAGAGPIVPFDTVLTDYPLPLGARLVLALTAGVAANTGRFRFFIKP